MRTRRFLVAPDAFKGAFDAATVAGAIGRGIEAAGGAVDLCPVADGGEGTAAALRGAYGGEEIAGQALDPLRRPIEAGYTMLGDGSTAVVEMASASGLVLVEEGERDAERADTFGTGQLIVAALRSDARRILVAVGGSATTDGGRGALEALQEAGIVPGSVELVVLCDVRTQWEDAAHVFAPQKGASRDAVARLSARLDAFAAELPRDPRRVPMSGAAGGLAGGLWAVYGAELRAGAPFVLDAVGFDRRLAAAGVAISGEGKIDAASFDGKLVGEIARRCAVAETPLHAIVGADGLGADAGGLTSDVDVRVASTLPEIEAAARAIATS